MALTPTEQTRIVEHCQHVQTLLDRSSEEQHIDTGDAVEALAECSKLCDWLLSNRYRWEKSQVKRYWVFAFNDWEAMGGLDDVQAKFDSYTEAREYAIDCCVELPSFHNVTIHDMHTDTLTWTKGKDLDL